MLKLFYAMRELDFSQLSQVYRESLRYDGEENRPGSSAYQQISYAEGMLYECFMTLFQNRGICAVWLQNGNYVSVLRLEACRDGYLIAGLETAPGERGKGIATMLMREVCRALADQGVNVLYSHIRNSNRASIKVHEKCGFFASLDHAVFLDGSVDTRSKTYIKKL